MMTNILFWGTNNYLAPMSMTTTFQLVVEYALLKPNFKMVESKASVQKTYLKLKKKKIVTRGCIGMYSKVSEKGRECYANQMDTS